MNYQNINVINKQIDSFPALPATVTQVMAITANPGSDAKDLMEVILPDQTMCSTILKIANSAFYGLPREVSTIERAVVVLGYAEIRNIVIGKAIFASFPKMKKEYKNKVELLWKHAFTCGLAAKIIASHYKMSSSELFIAGLIHDIGKLAMLMAFPHDYPLVQDISSPHHLLYSNEKDVFSITHDKVGCQIAKRWMLPEQLVMAIGYHHSPLSATKFENFPLIIQAADILALIYSAAENTTDPNVEKIFHDALPETEKIWHESNLTWKSENVVIWFESLHKLREDEQSIFQLFSQA